MRQFIEHHYEYVSAAAGAVIGYLLVHPFITVGTEYLHSHGHGAVVFGWKTIALSIADSFALEHMLHALTIVILCALMGYLYGYRIKSYRILNQSLEKFAAIGMHASGIIHDLNNPLTGIIGMAELMKLKATDPQIVKNSETIIQSSLRISRMVMEIKTATLEREKLKIEKSDTDLGTLVRQCAEQFKGSCEITVEIGEPVKLNVDQECFDRVLWNLLKNAKEAIQNKPDGRIVVKTSNDAGGILISVSDNGPGIPREAQEQLFGIGKTFGKRGGSGIGLYNCKKIIEAHGGKIWFESAPGNATTFYIKMPNDK